MRFKYANVTIEIKGFNPEKFINIAARRGMFFKNVQFIEKNKIRGDIDFESFRKLRPVARKAKCRMKIVEKRGMIYLLKKISARKIFLIEGILSFAILIFLSMLIGRIDINAPVTISKQSILDMLYKNGVRMGMMKFSVDDELLAKNIVLEFEDISWAEVSVKGMQLKVDVAEAIPKPHIVPYTQPCNVVAAKDGVIKFMDIKNGTAAVSLGTTVTKGDLLISSIMKHRFNEEDTYNVHAHGEVMASTWYRAEQIVNTVEIKRERTGQYTVNKDLDILGVKLGKWFRKESKYSEYDVIRQTDDVMLWGFIRLPVSWNKEVYYECTEEAIQIDGDKALENAKNAAYEKCMSQIPDEAQIVDVKFSYEKTQNDGICVVIIVECIENIGIETDLK